MKQKIILSIAMLSLLCMAVFVSAVVFEINPKQSSSLNSGNSVCEYYQNKFSSGESETITINGASLNIKYLGNGEWQLNDYQGEIQNHDFFTYNDNSNLKGVRFSFSMEQGSFSEGAFGLTEQDYYPWDCQGYSQSTGMVSEIKIKEGWNLVPFDISLRDCYYALNGELCKDDVLVSYVYIPTLNKYFTEEELEKEYETNSALRNYFSEENEFTLQKSSKWIYVKPGAGNKKVIGNFGAYIPYRNQYLDNGAFRLKQGWNFIFVDAFMVYDDSWQENPLSMDDIKGNCNVEKVYLWDFFDQQWTQINGEFDDDMVGYGVVTKVTEDCTLGYSGSTTTPPTLP
jgi:hypothetical protein|tara:strand:- start:249 stop:1274 length:1026 start_codon:yes stop_codon:yes gene_type:complete